MGVAVRPEDLEELGVTVRSLKILRRSFGRHGALPEDAGGVLGVTVRWKSLGETSRPLKIMQDFRRCVHSLKILQDF